MAGRVINDDQFEDLTSQGIGSLNLSNAMQAGLLEVRIEDKDPYVEIKNLPSGGRFYRNALNMPIKIKGMPLKVVDAVALEAMKNSNDMDVIDDVLRRRIKGVAPEDLLVMDRLYILAWLREQSFMKAPLRRTFQCESCGHVNLHRIVDLSSFVVYNLPDDVTEPSFDLPECQERVKLKFERRRDVKRTEDYIKKFEGLRQVSDADIKMYRIASVIEGMSIDTAMEFMADLSLIDFTILNTQFEKCNMGFTNAALLKCNNDKEECGHINLIHVPFRGNYYLPRIGLDMVDEG